MKTPSEFSTSDPEIHPADLFLCADDRPALATLAAEINLEHAAAERTARTAVDHARAAGDKLLLAKAQVDHGQWLPWLSANCPALADRTARSYMQLARNWAQLNLKSATVADLTINQALRLLNAPEPEAESLPLLSPAVVHLKQEPFDVRIDRKTPWGNPFELDHESDRATVIQQYAAWLATGDSLGMFNPAWVREQLPQLQGKRLGCWCAPKACHGDTLMTLANSLPGHWAALTDSARQQWIQQRTEPAPIELANLASSPHSDSAPVAAVNIEGLRQKHLERERFEANRAAFHQNLSQLLQGASIVRNPADCKDPAKWAGTWDAFHSRYC